jgi:hypothetical protein
MSNIWTNGVDLFLFHRNAYACPRGCERVVVRIVEASPSLCLSSSCVALFTLHTRWADPSRPASTTG